MKPHEIKALLAEAVKRGLKVTDLKGLKEELQANKSNYQGQDPKPRKLRTVSKLSLNAP